MDRRDFMKICSAGAVAVAAGSRSPMVYSGPAKDFAKVKLVDENGQPLKAASLGQKEAYVFNYPYAGIPCFLISLPDAAPAGEALKTSAGEDYSFTGGVGAKKNVVAYVAVCTHQFAYPKKSESQMGYNAGNSETAGRAVSITCCSHNSAFDPAAGGKVLTGKASQPLPGIRLEHDPATDEIYATGMYGADLIDDFFKKFKVKLNAELGFGKYKEEVTGSTQAVPLSKYSASADSC
jgi:arsenite oxidase small subunit